MTKIAITIQKVDFWPQISKFLGKKAHFRLSGQLEPHRSMFSTQKMCLIGLPIWGYQNFYSLPPKIGFWAQKQPNLAQKLAKYRHFWPIRSNAWPKNNADKLPKWFSVMLVPKHLLTPIKIWIFGPKTAKFGPKYAFLVNLGQILPFFAHFVQFPTKNQCKLGA